VGDAVLSHHSAGEQLGAKISFNNLISCPYPVGTQVKELSEHSRIILFYALCSFASFGGVGIMLVRMVAVAPEQRPEFAGLGVKALVAGKIAACKKGVVVALDI
jgi:CNT family concentrative nucleoside transporter